MKLPKRGERGFTLIELLIVVAILGVLAAVIIPNVGRFIGAGEEESQKTELANIQTAVVAMMVDNQLSALPNPEGTTPTNKMSEFPDKTSNNTDGDDPGTLGDKVSDPEGYAYDFTAEPPTGDLEGYLLYGHDITGSGGTTPNSDQTDVNYVATDTTAYWYTVDADGTVHQSTTAPTP